MLSSDVPSFFYNFDIFGLKPQLYFKSQDHSATKFGLLLSFLFLVFTVFCFFYFGQDLYYHTNPTIIFNEEYEPLPEKFVLNPEETPFVVEINSPYADEYYTDRSVVEARISQLTINKTSLDNSFSLISYEMEICNFDHFKNTDELTRDYFMKMKLSDYFCIPSKLKNLTAQGAFDQNIYQAIKVSFHMCNNETYFNKCKPAEYIKSKINRGFLGFYFKDLTIDPGNYESVARSAPKEVFTNFVLNSQKEIDIFLKVNFIYICQSFENVNKNNYVETEDGQIIENNIVQKIINYDHYIEFNFMQENEEFLMVYVRLDQKNTLYKRTYSKIQDLIAQVGGFINCFWLMAFGINYFSGNLLFIRDIISTVFDVRKKKEGIDPKNEGNKKIFEGSLIKKFDDLGSGIANNENFKNPVIKSNIKIEAKNSCPDKQTMTAIDMELIINENPKDNESLIEKIKLNFFDFIFYYLGICKTPEREQKKIILRKGMEIIRDNLNVEHIIKKFYEIEKLKVLLLDEKQLKLFDSLPKPELEVNGMEIITKVLKRKMTEENENHKFRNSKSTKKIGAKPFLISETRNKLNRPL